VLNLARKKLGPNLVDGHSFADAFYACICGTYMVGKFEFAENTHLQNMWARRKTWALVYFGHNFFPFTSTTWRSEGLNSYFKTLV
jgi:hypothetical protein